MIETEEIPVTEHIDVRDITRNLFAVISKPRFGPIDPALDLAESSGVLGLRHNRRGGAYWGQSMENCMEAGLAELDKQPVDPNQCLLAMDYDTPSTYADIVCLYGMLKATPEADAICALQMRRNCNEMLMMMRGDDGKFLRSIPGSLFDGRLVKIAAGHFGLTVIRASALRDLPHPWFLAAPAPDGRWGEGRVDEDVSFWMKWEKHQRSLYCAHEVAVAHGEWTLTWPGVTPEGVRPLRQSADDFDRHGKPANVWGRKD